MRGISMKKGVIAAATAGLAVSALFGAAPAQADGFSFLQSLNDRGLDVYDTTATLASGLQICHLLQTHNGRDVQGWVFTNSSYRDVPSLDVAAVWVVTAVEELCPEMDRRQQSYEVA